MTKTPVVSALLVAMLLSLGPISHAVAADGLPDAFTIQAQQDPSQQAMDSAPTSVLAPQADHYLFVAGSALTPRTSTTTLNYPGAGCINASAAVTTDLQLPNGSTLQGVRVYYYDDSPAGSVGLWVTKYNGLGSVSDIINSTMPHAAGYADNYVAAPAVELIDNFNHAYVLTALTDTDTRICGFRVFYSTP